jgi:hypothetical protein
MDSSKSVEDDTIRDEMESGDVATRPRFTRARRTWKVNVRNLQAEDVRALDEFFMSTTARGGNSFLMPNLLPNSSFEFPALTVNDLVAGWSASGIAQEAISIAAAAVSDGTQAIGFATVAGQAVPANSTVRGQLNCDQFIPCSAGETYVFTANVNAVDGTLAAGVLMAGVSIVFRDAHGNVLSTASGPAALLIAGWQAYGYQFTAPAGAVAFTVALAVALTNSGASALAVDGSASVTWDAVGCALLAPLTPYGRMVGSASLGCRVRFSKLPETADIGYGNGVKRYGANFEVTEV